MIGDKLWSNSTYGKDLNGLISELTLPKAQYNGVKTTTADYLVCDCQFHFESKND